MGESNSHTYYLLTDLLYSGPKPSQLTRNSSTLVPVPPIEKRSPSRSNRSVGVWALGSGSGLG